MVDRGTGSGCSLLEGRMLPVCCNASSPMLMELIYALNLVYLTTLRDTCESQPWVLSWWRLTWRFSREHGLTNWTNNGPTHTHTHMDWRHTQISCSGTTITCIILLCANMRIHPCIQTYSLLTQTHTAHTPHSPHTTNTPHIQSLEQTFVSSHKLSAPAPFLFDTC